MKARGTGMMGYKFFCGFVLALAAFASSSHAGSHSKKPRLATVLPSKVKTITLQASGPARGRAHASTRRKGRDRVRSAERAPAPETGRTGDASRFAPELREIAEQNGGSNKYYKSSVRYVRSAYPLTSEFDCDSDTAEQKKAEAESTALAQCEADGAANCRLAGSLVATNGELHCRDFPGGTCPASGHFRGCVGQALVLGEKSALSAGL